MEQNNAKTLLQKNLNDREILGYSLLFDCSIKQVF